MARRTRSMAQVFIPEWMRDEENVTNPHGSAEVRARHVLKMCKQQYTLSDVLALAEQNTGVNARVDRLLQARRADDEPPPLEPLAVLADGVQDEDMENLRMHLGGDAHLAECTEAPCTPEQTQPAEGRSELKVASATEVWMSVAARTASQHVAPFMLICMSLLALKSGMAEEMWSMLSFNMILLSKPWVTKFAADVAAKLRSDLLTM